VVSARLLPQGEVPTEVIPVLDEEEAKEKEKEKEKETAAA
jgi:hypothetical protein